MLPKSALLALTLFSICAFSIFTLQAETFNGPTTLKDKTFDELTINGPANLYKVKAKSLTVKGPMKFYQVDVMGKATIDGRVKGKMGKFQDLIVKGPIKAAKITVKTLNVVGPATLKYFTIMDNSIITGPVNARKGSFQDLSVGPDLGLHGKVFLKDVSVNNIRIKTEGGQEVLELEGNTDIAGTLTLESKKGNLEKKGSELKSTDEAKELAPKS